MIRHVSPAALLAASLATSLAAQAPCFESNLGSNLGLGDDAVAQNLPLGFTFPGPGNVQVTDISVSSNGFVWLGSSFDSGCCNGDQFAFVSGLPRIAPVWMDLYPPSGNGVFFNTFPAAPGVPARAVITWDQVPEYANNVPFTVQLQLFDNGSFTFLYDGNVTNAWHTMLVGVTEGNNATPNSIDFSSISSSNPYLSGANPTLFEEQSQVFDLAGSSYQFLPNGSGGYIVLDRPNCAMGRVTKFGRGCPQPAVAYELFDWQNLIDLSNTAIDFVGNATAGYVAIPTTGFFTGYSNVVPAGDDTVSGPYTLPFTFTFPGGSTNQIDISSNGFLWLSTGNWDPRCCYGDPTTFLNDGPSIAALWQDLNPNNGGNVYFDVDPNGTEVHITWANVPEYYNTGANTAQITLRSDGSFRLSWQNVANVSHDCLVGFSQGNGALDPGSIDFSAALPFTMSAGGAPLALDPQFGSRPQIGGTFTMEIGSYPASSLFGVMALGLIQHLTGIDLTGLGMPGCRQHVSLDATQFVPLLQNPAPFAMTLPNNTAFLGLELQAQALTLSPGVNALGVVSSNGLTLRVGN
jgi:hypothetical protein